MARRGDAQEKRATDENDPTSPMSTEGLLWLLSRAIEQTTNVVVITDASGDIQYVNPGFTATTGYSPEEVIGKHVSDLGEQSAEEEKRLWETITSGGEWQGEFHNRKKNGEPYWLSASISPIRSPAGVITHFLGCSEDITERKRADEALRESEEKWRSLLENMPDIVMTLDRKGTILYISRTVPGFTAEGVIGKSAYDYLPEEYHEGLAKALERVFDAGEVETYEIAGAGPYGRTSWYYNRIGPIWRDGKVVAATVVSTDITERKRAEEALRQSEERFRSAFDHSATGMALVAPDGRLLRVNRRCCEALGYSEQELASMTWQSLTHPDDLDATHHHLRLVLAGEIESFQLEKRFIHKRGHTLWGHLTSSLVRDADGKPVYFITQIQDITERKRAEEALRQSEEKYRDLVENLNDVIYEVDVSGRITYISPVIEQLSGYSPAEVIGRSFAEFVHPDDLAPLKEGFQRNLSGSPEPNEYRVLAKSGEMHWVRTFSRPILDGDRVVGLRGVLASITERKRAEEALRESEEKYRELVENVNETIYELDAGGRITYMSPVAEEGGDYRVAEFSGRHITDFIHPDDRERVRRSMERSLRGHSEPIEFRILARSGETRWRRSSARLVTKDGRVVGLRGVVTDITESKRAEEALREREETVVALLNARTESALLMEIDGTILALNHTAAERLGGSVDDLVGASAFHRMPAGVAAYSKARSDEVLHSREPLRFEDQRDGRWFDTTIYPIIDAEGKVARLAVLASDITGLKEMEKALEEAREELESKVESQMQRETAYGLTFRELTVLHLVAAGKPDKEIATLLAISPRTANKHVENILNKMGASSRTEAGVRAVREGLLD